MSKYKMEISFLVTSNPLNLEHKLLNQYEANHDEQPPFNHADTRRFEEKPSESSVFVDHLRVTKVEGKE